MEKSYKNRSQSMNMKKQGEIDYEKNFTSMFSRNVHKFACDQNEKLRKGKRN